MDITCINRIIDYHCKRERTEKYLWINFAVILLSCSITFKSMEYISEVAIWKTDLLGIRLG